MILAVQIEKATGMAASFDNPLPIEFPRMRVNDCKLLEKFRKYKLIDETDQTKCFN